jgi:hypothetical protein
LSKKIGGQNILGKVSHEDIRKTYKFHKLIGAGQFGSVRIATRHNIPDVLVCVKSIPSKN